ncbi:MAG: transcriptional activator NhaR [Pseudomonadales bacterium]|jgi:LysR family transcriptional activator of nhaA|nr:transcriptional activator NhaR [Pseudomonadales bacterium]
MRHLNYTHLLYFWTVAREGSVARAAEVLNLTPQTISGQIKLLEETIGHPLFHRVGRGLALTETGEVVRQYADEIFSLGAELTHRVKTEKAFVTTTFNVGIVDSIPKLIALRILEPAFQLEDSLKVVCIEGTLDKLLADLAIHKLDLVISDRSLPSGMGVKAYSHPLGECTVSFFASKTIARKYRQKFPESLNDAPVLMPIVESAVRRNLDDWFDQHGIRPNVVAEFSDSALLKAFGEAGYGVFPAPTAISEEITSMYHATCLGEIDSVSEQFFAISPERKLRHPAVLALTEHSRNRLFS